MSDLTDAAAAAAAAAAVAAAAINCLKALTTGADVPALVQLQPTSEQLARCLHAMFGRRQASCQNSNFQFLATLSMPPGESFSS